MIYQCWKVLRHLRRLAKGTDLVMSFSFGEHTEICLVSDSDQRYDCAGYEREIKSIIKALADGGRVEYKANSCQFSLTSRGLHPWQWGWEDVKSFLFRSIAVPIFVAFVTAFLTTRLIK